MHNRRDLLEIKSTPEQEKYLRNSFWKEYFGKSILRRGTWIVALLLSIGSVVPLSFKFLLNLIDSIFDPSSLKEAGKNLVGIILLPILGGTSSALSILPIPTAIPYSPSKLGGHFVKTLMLPIKLIYKVCKNKIDKQVAQQNSLGENSVESQNSTPDSADSKQKKKYLPFFVNGIDSVEIPDPEDEKTNRYRIVFNAAAEIYQFNFAKYEHESKALHCHTRTFNYPGTTSNNLIDSGTDLINAGIAEVYDLAKKMNWSNADIEANLHFYGYCFGGGIALQVAVYFKEKHHVNIKVFVDRSYASLVSAAKELLNAISGLPVWYAKILSAVFLYASGELNLDSVAAIKKLNPENVFPLNLSLDDVPSEELSFTQQLKRFFGIGKLAPVSDMIIRGEAGLADALLKQDIVCGHGTRKIYSDLNAHSALVFSAGSQGHFLKLQDLPVKTPVGSIKTALNYYVAMMENDSSITNPAEHNHRFSI